jgi:hypothetical protein
MASLAASAAAGFGAFEPQLAAELQRPNTKSNPNARANRARCIVFSSVPTEVEAFVGTNAPFTKAVPLIAMAAKQHLIQQVRSKQFDKPENGAS